MKVRVLYIRQQTLPRSYNYFLTTPHDFRSQHYSRTTQEKLQASCQRTTNCADSATYEVTDPEPEP